MTPGQSMPSGSPGKDPAGRSWGRVWAGFASPVLGGGVKSGNGGPSGGGLPSKCLTLSEPRLPCAGLCGVRGGRRGWRGWFSDSRACRPEASQAASSRCGFLLQTKGRDFVCSVQESCYHPLGSWVSPAPLRAVAGRTVRVPPHPCPCIYSGHRCPLAPFRTNRKNPQTQPPPPLQVSREVRPVLCSPGTCSPHCGSGHRVSPCWRAGQVCSARCEGAVLGPRWG